jgi:CheY-like chemotaxis protein/HPt (histidine-containing phosphotransfer) domain-containing protein
MLVEDDPVSRAVMGAAIERCGVQADTADCPQAALRLASPARHALWLIDAHLPDGSGIELFAALRGIDSATVAIAHTASLDSDIHARLRRAGFVDVIVKPLHAEQVAEMLRRWLPVSAPAIASAVPMDAAWEQNTVPLWDDAAALRALNGNRDHVVALRSLFVTELVAVAARISAAVLTRDDTALRAGLHRLHASCGFVGAARLGAAARALEIQRNDVALQYFEATARATLEALDETQPA